eukprot:g4419.t1
MDTERSEFLVRSRLEFTKATEGRPEMNLMQFIMTTGCRSRYYAVAAFDAIDKSKTGRIRFGDYIQFKKLLTFGSIDEKSSFVFSLLDRDGDGWLDEDDIQEGLKASSEENDRALKKDELARLLEVLMRLFVTQPGERIGRERFQQVLQGYPDLLGSFQLGEGFVLSLNTLAKSTKRFAIKAAKRTKRWALNHPIRLVSYIFTFIVITGAFFWLFWKFSGDCSDVNLEFRDPITNVTRHEIQDLAREYFGVYISDEDARYMSFSAEMSDRDSLQCRDARLRKLLSWTLPMAKGSGRAMKVIFTLILFPVSRSLMTRLRDTFLRHLFDFDGAISYHKMLGTVGFVFAWIHSTAHFVHIYRCQNSANFNKWSFAYPFDEQEGVFALTNITGLTPHIDGVPTALIRADSEQPSATEMLKSSVVLTGFFLLSIFSIAALYAFDYPRKLALFTPSVGQDKTQFNWTQKSIERIGRHLNNFNTFWYSHQLFAAFYVLLVFHPMPQNPREEANAATDAWVWILIPVLVYLMDRIHRALRWARQTPLTEITTLPGRVLALKTEKPEDFEYKAGQYVMIKCNRVSRFEWHPFTLTSAPQDPFLSVHIRAIGDWTNAMYNTLKDCTTARQREHNEERGDVADVNSPCPKTLLIAGPYGAPSQAYQDYRVVMCIGAGIGVTPFASILSNVLHCIRSSENQKMQKVYFHWVVRSRSEASWFASLLDEIANHDIRKILELTIHITNMKSASDLRLMLLRLAEFESIHLSGVSRTVSSSIVRFGRPNWNQILSRQRNAHPNASKIGVFYCGPNALKRTLKTHCEKINQSSGLKFVFNKEVF